MREIKFRAWDTQTNRMYNDIGGGSEEYRYTINQQIERYQKDNLWFLMLYTGLKDAVGTDIYESDIVKWSIADDARVIGDSCCISELGTIIWSSALPGFLIDTGEHLDSLQGSTIEVIGNIYENPELIK